MKITESLKKAIAKIADTLTSVADQELEEFTKTDSLIFFMFLDAWVKHIRDVAGEARIHEVDWLAVRGYRAFIPSFIYFMNRNKMGFTKDLQDCCCSMLLTEPSLINFYFNYLFSKTNVYDIFGTVSK